MGRIAAQVGARGGLSSGMIVLLIIIGTIVLLLIVRQTSQKKPVTKSANQKIKQSEILFLNKIIMIAAVVMIVGFFILPLVEWETPPQGPSGAVQVVYGHPVSAVTLATKADVQELWLLPISAVLALLSAFGGKQLTKSTVMIVSGIVGLIGVAAFFAEGISGPRGIEKLAYLGTVINHVSTRGWLIVPLGCACVFIFGGVHFRRLQPKLGADGN